MAIFWCSKANCTLHQGNTSVWGLRLLSSVKQHETIPWRRWPLFGLWIIWHQWVSFRVLLRKAQRIIGLIFLAIAFFGNREKYETKISKVIKVKRTCYPNTLVIKSRMIQYFHVHSSIGWPTLKEKKKTFFARMIQIKQTLDKTLS